MKKNSIKFVLLSICIILVFSFNALALSSNASRATKKTEDKVDYDLVALNNTMLYSQITNMTNEYQKYLGKRIRLVGNMNVINSGTDKNYYMVMAGDATGCCTAGFEFIIKGGSEKEKDYPKSGERVLVNGILEKYKEGNQEYLHLVNSDVSVLKKNEK